MAAVEDSWRAARRRITDGDLNALQRAIQNVLGAVDPRLELPPEDRWSAAIYGKVRVHSSDLRKGLGRTIALMGARGDEVRLSGGRSGRQWAERVVWNLLRRANEDGAAHLWASLEDVLPLIAEAAPDMFLRAVTEAASGPQPLLRELFQDQDGGGSWRASSPHTGLLWALECVAWSGRHLGFAAELLAELAEIDPGGRLSNRPAASLQNIFLPWLPQTSAATDTRIKTLDALLHRHRDVTWQLLLALLPEHSAVGMHTYKPQFRDWAGRSERTVTYGELFTVVEAVADRAVQVAIEEPARWTDLIPEFDRLPDGSRRRSIAALHSIDRDALDHDVLVAVWNAIDDLVRKHRQYPDAEWRLSEEWLSPLASIGAHLRPRLPTEMYRWLFESWRPEIGLSVADNFTAYEAELRHAREEAVVKMLTEEGFGAVLELARTVQLPWALGSALASVNDKHDYRVLSLLDSEEPRLFDFANGLARARAANGAIAIRPWIERFAGRALVQARLLQTLPDVTDAWELLLKLGPEVERAYWSEFVPDGRGADFAHVSDVVRHLLRHGRPAAAVDALSLYVDLDTADVDVDTVLDSLRQLGTVGDDPDIGRHLKHDLTTLLSYLRSRGVDEAELASLEWKFLPALHDPSQTLALHRLLARDPLTFLQFVELAFKPVSSETRDEPLEVDPNVAANAYRLLHSWRVVPGTRDDGTVDAAALQGWLDQAELSSRKRIALRLESCRSARYSHMLPLIRMVPSPLALSGGT